MSKLFTVVQDQVSRILAGATDAGSLKSRQTDAKFITTRMNERVCAEIDSALPDFAAKFAAITPVKAVKRAAQFVQYVVTGVESEFEPSTAFLVSMVVASKQKRIAYADAMFLMGGVGSNDTAHIKGLSASKLKAILSAVHPGTIQTRLSSGVGKNGFMTAMGIVAKSDAHGFEVSDKNHPLILAYAAKLEKVSDGKLTLLMQAKAK